MKSNLREQKVKIEKKKPFFPNFNQFQGYHLKQYDT